nr:BLUF domain-containing protein [Fulvivirga sp. M361]
MYKSAARPELSKKDLKEISRVSSSNNAKEGISGMLLYVEGEFLQLLEGEKEKVLTTFSRISIDGRHTDINIICESHQKQRQFEEWNIGFYSLTGKEFQDKTGFKSIKSYFEADKYQDEIMLVFLLKQYAELANKQT